VRRELGQIELAFRDAPRPPDDDYVAEQAEKALGYWRPA
jgi:hypothetical protein